jgi:hypothetical protein
MTWGRWKSSWNKVNDAVACSVPRHVQKLRQLAHWNHSTCGYDVLTNPIYFVLSLKTLNLTEVCFYRVMSKQDAVYLFISFLLHCFLSSSCCNLKTAGLSRLWKGIVISSSRLKGLMEVTCSGVSKPCYSKPPQVWISLPRCTCRSLGLSENNSPKVFCTRISPF